MLSKEILKQLIDIVGQENAITDKVDLLTYSYDSTADVPTETPDVVLAPANTAQVSEIVKIAAAHKIPIYTRGSGTNLSGGTIPLKKGIVLSMRKMNQIKQVDAENLVAIVEPGVVIQDLNNAVAPHGLIYPPDPGTVATATMGGSVAENSGGLRGLKYGVTKHYVMGMEVVLSNGDIVRVGGKTVKNVTGYDLAMLFTGSEGTLAIITEITVKLMPAPQFKKSFLAIFKTLEDAGNTVSQIVENKVIPATLEIMDNATIRTVENFAKVGLPVEAAALLLIEVDGLEEVVKRDAEVVKQVVIKNNGELKVAETEDERATLWAARRAALPALASLNNTTVLEDATVPRSQVTAMLVACQELGKKYNLTIGTFGHAGDGNLHPTILCDSKNADEMSRVHKAVDELFEIAVNMGGTLSGEHGIGMAKMKYLELEFGPTGVDLLRRVKEALDPDYILNPGKMVPLKGE
jgi:glycolate oxidase